MALSTRLDLRQTQSLVMTPQLQQAIKLLALSNLDIEAFIGDAMEANPLLELGAPADDGANASAPDGVDAPYDNTPTLSADTARIDQLIRGDQAADSPPLDIDRSALDTDHDTGDGQYRELAYLPEGAGGNGAGAGHGGPDEAPDIGDAGDIGPTLARHLHEQIGAQAGLAMADETVTAIARFLIDQLDEAGYLPIPLAEAAEQIGATPDAAKAALALLQSLEPTGVGARDLAECIALQAREADRYDPAMARLINNLAMVARGELARLQRMCGVDDEDFADMLAELRAYNPKPGLAFGGAPTAPVVPDILVMPRDDGDDGDTGNNSWVIMLNPATLPRLIINRSYYLEMKGGCTGKVARGWLSEKLTDAHWLIKALDQRQKTILKVTSELVRQQDGFFRHGVAHLRPLTLRAVAEATGLHESTISRVTSNKYLHCGRGTFELRYFFTSGVASADGEGTVSAEAVKAAIRTLIDAEAPDAILSDDTLVDMLRARGFDLARRTVAKYREAIGLGSSVQRRRQKTLNRKAAGVHMKPGRSRL